MTIAPVYRARSTERNRRTKAQGEQLDQQIIDMLANDHPQSVGHVFYRLTNPRLAEPVEKSDRGYRHVQYRVVELRLSGQLPDGWITDVARRGYFTSTYRDASDFLRRMRDLYRADLWQAHDLPTRPHKETDRRSLQVGKTVDAEAMPDCIMRRILRSEIEALLSLRALDVARAAELSERDRLLTMANIAGGSR